MQQKRVNTLSSECEQYIVSRQLVTEEDLVDSFGAEEEEDGLMARVQQLEEQLKGSQEREERLKMRNKQLLKMVSYSTAASVKNAHQFTLQVETIVQQKITPPNEANSTWHQSVPEKKLTHSRKCSSNYSTQESRQADPFLPFSASLMGREQVRDRMAYLNKIMGKVASVRP